VIRKHPVIQHPFSKHSSPRRHEDTTLFAKEGGNTTRSKSILRYCDMADLIESTLCVACKSIFSPPSNTIVYTSANGSSSHGGEIPHHGLEALAARASKCHLCLAVFMSIDPELYRNFRRTLAGGESLGFAAVSPIARDQARLKFRYVRPIVPGSQPNGHGPPVDQSRPSTTSSKTSGSSSKVDAGLEVELILMNPKCKF
jgi:hypothetical protein